jgi:hypothetical protein
MRCHIFRLKQSPALRPFRRQAIISTNIATLASDHNIGWVIRAASCKGDNVINVRSAWGVAQLLAAPITFVLLSLTLCLNVLRGASPLKFTDAAVVLICYSLFAISSVTSPGLLIDLVPSSIASDLLLRQSLFMVTETLTMIDYGNDCFNLRFLTAFSRIRRHILASLIGIVMLSLIVCSTVFALCAKSVSIMGVPEKVFGGSRIQIWALAALLEGIVLRYNIFHERNQHFLSSFPRMIPVIAGVSLCPHYSIKPLHKQVYGGVKSRL